MSNLSGRLYDHFQREHAVFTLWLLILVSLCAFFLFVFVPYIATTHELVQSQPELNTLRENNERAQPEITTSPKGIVRASNSGPSL